MVKKRRGQSAAFMARIRKLRGKKKTVVSKSKLKRRSTNTMVKRRVGKRRTARRTSGMSGIMQQGVGIGAYILFEAMVEPKLLQMANIQNPLVVNAAELALGMWASRRPGILGQAGKAAIVVNLYQILHPYLSNLGNGSVASNGLFN
jgi:hypothetical protein